MALTPTEIEAKIAALEDRIGLLFQTTDNLESLVQQGEERWFRWAQELREALRVINRQMDRVRRTLPARLDR